MRLPLVREIARSEKCRSRTKSPRCVFNALVERARQGNAARPPRGKELPRSPRLPVFLIDSHFSSLRHLCAIPLLVHHMLYNPRMDLMTAMAASGLRSRIESLDLLANNMANASTGGYKADREFYSLYTTGEAQDSGSSSTMPVVQKPYIDLSQGPITTTGNSLDVALSGQGFFGVTGPNGTLYTRNGGFRLAANGQLVTADGYSVRSVTGTPLTAQSTLPIDISRDGTLTQEGQPIGQMEIADFTSTAGLAKQGGTYFRQVDPTVKPAAATGTTVEQGKLEASNTGTAESAVRLVTIMRQFEMLQKAVMIGNDMGKEAIEQVAKVGS
jgi:flagellar basal-body rod protein FlgF